MTTFELPIIEGKPIDILDFKVDLLISPPEVKERLINTVDSYVLTSTGSLKIDYKDAPTDEGYLNIYLCRFKTGKYRIHIFGRIRGQEFRAEREIKNPGSKNLVIIGEKIKYVLLSSRNILRAYYLNANVKNIEEHLMALKILVFISQDMVFFGQYQFHNWGMLENLKTSENGLSLI